MSIPRNLSIIADTLNSDGTFASISNTGSTTLSSGTANGVAYLNGSKVLTTGSALTFDGTNLGVKGGSFVSTTSADANYKSVLTTVYSDSATTQLYNKTLLVLSSGTADGTIFYNQSGVEAMRLTSTGLGLGTSSPAFPLDVGGPFANIRVAPSTATNNALTRYVNTGGTGYVGLDNSTGALTAAYALNLYHTGAYPIVFSTSGAERMRIDSSGNVGIGTSSPAFGLSVQKDNGSGYVALFRKSVSDVALTIQTTSSITQIQGLNAALSAVNDIAMQLSGGNVGIGTSTPSASAILDAQSTTKGVRMPNMTTTQKNAISSPAAGLMVFDTTLAKLCVYSGSAWQTVTSI